MSIGMSMYEVASFLKDAGCVTAIYLDGGGSATLYYNGQVMNKLINNYERPCGDFLYFTN